MGEAAADDLAGHSLDSRLEALGVPANAEGYRSIALRKLARLKRMKFQYSEQRLQLTAYLKLPSLMSLTLTSMVFAHETGWNLGV